MPIAYAALAGGGLIGVAATVLLGCCGRIAGISGILYGAIAGASRERLWRIWFLLGLIGAAAVTFQLFPGSVPNRAAFPRSALMVAGVLVGFGTRMGNGCTSGHGVCGLGRLSLRSLVAVLVFMGTAMMTVALTRHAWRVLP